MTPKQYRRSMIRQIAKAEQLETDYRSQRLAIMQRAGVPPEAIAEIDRLDDMLDILRRIRGKANRALADLNQT